MQSKALERCIGTAPSKFLLFNTLFGYFINLKRTWFAVYAFLYADTNSPIYIHIHRRIFIPSPFFLWINLPENLIFEISRIFPCDFNPIRPGSRQTNVRQFKMYNILERFIALVPYFITFSFQILCIISEKTGPERASLVSQPWP